MNFATEKVAQDTVTTIEKTEKTEVREKDKVITTTKRVKTGDTNLMLRYSVIALASGVVCLILAVVTMNRRKKEDGNRHRGKERNNMLKWKKLFVSLLSVSVIAGLGAAPVKAAQTVTPYTYKVTLSAGNKGTINGQQKVEEVDLAAGSTVSFDINDIKVSDEKYYVKGIRLSGRDNSEALAAPAFRVNGDADYVVAYGIKGDMVAYTVNYEDEQGNKLAESQTFYGNVGDKPVVAYRYIENYVPQRWR